MSTLDQFLTKRGMTRYQVAKVTDTYASRWAKMSKDDLSTWRLKSLFSLSEAVHMHPDQVLKELLEIERRE